ncbi:hypothetical protein V1520DRAFT_391716 [Lipomyces starkeyi]|uniref:NAD-dependent epimerase/dehydratase domain-containing protein n=1 Tax=Lipomyces starkeyi NRRL Y-11557 TaxID=675824 RepID=A0A1E3Q1P0_LIPST|nr:hypothetical protein LIPSTDRAFT_4844 [Lipomyces starkeyi NRRL Y-11557]
MAGELVFLTGATGHVGFAVLVATLKAGYRVRASVRRQDQIDEIKAHPSIESFVGNLDFVIVPDITVSGAFDACLHGVTYVEHVASPLPRPTEDPENDIIIPAVRGTTSILNSALKVESIRRVVITSSVVAVIPSSALSNGDSENVYTANSRVRPLPSAPWGDYSSAYRASKVLALDATDRFLADRRPHFSIVNVMPGYVIGANELVSDASKVGSGSNGVVMGIVMGQKASVARPCSVVDVQDVARTHLAALDEQRVEGSKSFLLDSDKVSFDDAIDIVKKYFPEAVKDGTLPLGGSIPAAHLRLDVSDTIKTFGPLKNYEAQVKSVVAHYLALQSKPSDKTN